MQFTELMSCDCAVDIPKIQSMEEEAIHYTFQPDYIFVIIFIIWKKKTMNTIMYICIFLIQTEITIEFKMYFFNQLGLL